MFIGILINNVCPLETNANKINLGGEFAAGFEIDRYRTLIQRLAELMAPRMRELAFSNCSVHRLSLPCLHAF